jgi:hypothetical protein
MKRFALALLFSGLMLNVAVSSEHESEGRRMLVFAVYGAAGTMGSSAAPWRRCAGWSASSAPRQ